MKAAFRIDRVLFILFAGALLALAVVHGCSRFSLDALWNPPARFSSVLPSAFGIVKGQAVLIAGHPGAARAGSVVALEPVEGGVQLRIELDPGLALHDGAHVTVRPAPAPKPAVMEIVLPASGPPLTSPARIPSNVLYGPPEGMLEPSPSWSPETRQETGTRRSSLSNPFDPGEALAEARRFWIAGRPGKAMNLLAPFVLTLPDGETRARVLAAYGTCAYTLGLFQEAVSALRECTRLGDSLPAAKPVAEVALFNLALAERRRGESLVALDLLERAERNDVDALLVKAAALSDLGRLTEAVTLLEVASAASPVASLNYAVMLRANGMLSDALRVLRHLEEAWGGEALVHYHMARTYEAAGQDEEARLHYLAAAEREKDTALADIFRRQATRDAGNS